MVPQKIRKKLRKYGYLDCKSDLERTALYYRYANDGFRVVILADAQTDRADWANWQTGIEKEVYRMFRQPQGRIPGSWEGKPIGRVELLTVFCSNSQETLRKICGCCVNAWGYLTGEDSVLIYETQPGDFYGLREVLESGGEEKAYAEALRQWPVTIALVLINAAVYAGLELFGDTRDGAYIAAHGGLYADAVLKEHEWWRLLTAGFIHFGAPHLINNMVIFVCIGTKLEETAGHVRMSVIYLISLLGASALSLYMMSLSGGNTVAAGASGAVFGVIGAMLWAVICHRGRLQGLTTRRLVFMILLSLYYGFSATGIDNWGHVGGLAAGLLSAVLFYPRKKRQRKKEQTQY